MLKPEPLKFRLFFCCLLASLCAFAGQARALNVENIRFGTYPDKIRMVIELSEVADFRAFVLDNPYRLVVDLPGFNWQTGMIERPDSAAIQDVRQGRLQPGISRIVFDLSKAMAIQSAFVLPGGATGKNRLVIDYSPVGFQDFKSARNKIFGTLDPDRMKPETVTQQDQNGVFPPRPPIKPSTSYDKTPQYKPLVVIDPGHGGIDPGTIGKNHLYEKDIVLKIGHELKKELLATGRYRVIMTREDDTFIKLKDRVTFARNHKADLFISLHADSTPDKNTRGTSVYTLSKKASDQQTAKLAEKENSADLVGGIDLSTEDEQVAYILGDFLMTDTMNQSKFFANTLVSNMKATRGVSLLRNPHRYAGFAVLKAPDIPSILIETGFMSNANEANLLNQSRHRRQIASAIVEGVNAYFEHVQRNEMSE